MVFFTCNHCGESVKKPAVEKHYQWKCRNEVFVSCMDCQKDFRGDEYVAHTRCITEAEKYSGKDYVPKESKNSGQRKQDSWLEIVRSILTSNEYKVSPTVRGIFQKLQNHDNVPRKKAKFQNFVTNCMRLHKNQAEEVWSVLEKALEKLKKPSNDTNATANSTANGEENAQKESSTAGDTEEVPVENGEQVKKKKKSKKDTETPENDALNNNEPAEEDSDKSKKKKKKNKTDAESCDLNNSLTNGDTENPKKKKKNKTESSNLNTSEQLTNGDTESPKKKKKRSKEDKIADEPAEEEPPVKKSKAENGLSNSTNSQTPTSFDWTEVIFSILGKNNDEISLDKLKKKVLKKYKEQHNIEQIPWKVEKTFNKKLKKSGLLVEDNIVKINIK